MKRSWLPAVVLLGAATGIGTMLPAVANAPPKAGDPAPAFSLPIVDNGRGTLTLASLRGRVVYLNFFASWCPPCKAEVPYIATLSRQFAKQGVVVVGIDELENDRQALGFAQRYRLPYPIVVDGTGSVGGAYGLFGLPLHVFIARNGTVALWRDGEMSQAQVRAELETLARTRTQR